MIAFGPRRGRQFGHDLGLRVGQRQDDRRVGHLRDHLGLQHAGARQAEEQVGALDHVAKTARGRRVARIPPSGRSCPRSRPSWTSPCRSHSETFSRLTPSFTSRFRQAMPAAPPPVDTILMSSMSLPATRSALVAAAADDDGGAVLVVVEDRDVHPLAASFSDDEALGRLDVLQVDRAEGGLQRDDDLDQLVGIGLVQFDVEAVDIGEFLEQDRLALHHRLGRPAHRCCPGPAPRCRW